MQVRERAGCLPGGKAFQTDGTAEAKDMACGHAGHGGGMTDRPGGWNTEGQEDVSSMFVYSTMDGRD